MRWRGLVLRSYLTRPQVFVNLLDSLPQVVKAQLHNGDLIVGVRNACKPAAGSMDPNCCVRGCVTVAKDKLYGQFHDCSVSGIDTAGVAGQRNQAQNTGHLSAAKLKVGMLVAARSRSGPTDPYIIGAAADCGERG